MKIFISQPMNGLTDEEILNKRNKVIEEVKNIYKEDVEVIDSFLKDYNPEKNCALKYLSKSIEMLADADLAVFIDNWGQYRGCRIEHLCAVNYGIDCKYIDFNKKEKLKSSEESK